MGQKLVIGPFNKGLRNDVTAFNIDNDSFPTLINAYQWRGRVKRKRGTSLLNRLSRYFDSTSTAYSSVSTITLDGGGVGNLLSGAFGITTLSPNAVLVIGSVTVTNGGTDYVDQGDGTFSPSGTLNYNTGEITILAEAGNAVTAVFRYYPVLPVMGLEELIIATNQFPGTLAFDTVYSYEISTNTPYSVHDVSFYNNPAVNATTLPGYTPKTVWTPTTWNGQDYQQFWTVNYQGALWATNGINVPFSITNIGMQFKSITGVAIITAGNGTTIPAVADLTIVAHGLVQGDFVFVNEVEGITGINFQTGYVTSANPQAANTVRVTFPFAVLGGAYTSGGIAQYLTNRSDTTKDCIRWYNGDPTDGTVTPASFTNGKGWVNFCPPLSQSDYILSDLPAGKYYLVGARLILPFKDRLLFFGPVVQTSDANSQRYLQDTVIYSQNGTPYYTCSFFGDPVLSTTVFNPVLVPADQTATAPAFFADQTGFGGFIQAGVDQPIISVSSNDDVLIVGFQDQQSRLVYSGSDIVPFNFYTINSEYGTGSTFSAVNLDKGVLSRGQKGYIITSQVETGRIDLEIPDAVFQVNLLENGLERICAQRDFINEWIYFTYPSNRVTYKFPNQTLQFNYRDKSWAVFNETYTTYGIFRPRTGYTWATVGELIAETWEEWNDPWNAGTSTLLQPQVVAGNQQGFVMMRDNGTGEETSLSIESFSGNQLTVPNHCLDQGDFIIISDCLGTISSEVNGNIYSVGTPITTDTFTLNPPITGSGTYLGGGLITRMYRPFIQTKQFPLAWDMARKTRLGVQQYLFTTTQDSEVTLLIYLSQDSTNPYNEPPIIPENNPTNSSLIYSTVLYTCPESTNLGLTPANVNLQMPTAKQQNQIWHRLNTSLIGDTVQLGITLSDDQMRDTDFISQFDEIELHSIIIDVSPGPMLA